MHMFTIHVLSLKKLNITIHYNIIFMVIAYNHNMDFIIHLKKNSINKIRFIIIWYYKKFTQKMNVEFIVEVCVFLYY